MNRYALACLGALMLVACGGGGGDGGDDSHDVAAQYAGPIGSSDTARGAEVYDSVCSACHSSGPALENIAWSAGRMRQQIREGSGRMPPISENRVSAEDLEAVLAHLVTIGAVEGEAAPPATGGGAEPMDEEPMDDGSMDDGDASDTGADTDA